MEQIELKRLQKAIDKAQDSLSPAFEGLYYMKDKNEKAEKVGKDLTKVSNYLTIIWKDIQDIRRNLKDE